MEVKDLTGLTMTSVEAFGNEEIRFLCEDGRRFVLYHEQDCCESVALDDVCGDLSDLVGVPLLLAEEVSNDPPKVERDYEPESETWTFYKFSTVKGDVTLRWYGESNGYYSESVDFAPARDDWSPNRWGTD